MTSRKWYVHFTQAGGLVDCGLLRRPNMAEGEVIIAWGTYFAVPKDDEVARSIFNGK